MENLHERANMVRSMEMIVRSINDESFIDSWLMVGVGDGDINGEETDEELEYYCRDENFADLMALFCRIMRRATKGEETGNGVLYFDDIVSKREE